MKKIFLFAVGFFVSLTTVLFWVNSTHADGSLVAYWKLDETTSGGSNSVVDSSGNGYNGTPHNSPPPSTDIPSAISFSDPRSLSFNGTQWVSIPDNAAFAFTNATFSVWVKFSSTPGDMNMIAKRSAGGSNVQWQFGYSSNNNNFKVSLANGGNSCCTDFNWSPSPTLTANTWYNIAVTIDVTNHTLIWYQDGISKKTQDITGKNLGTQIVGTDLTLGASYNGNSERLMGLLDDVRIYNTALTDSEVASIASGGTGPGVPTPTPSPTPIPTPIPSSGGSSSESTSSSNNPDTSCNNAPPTSTPNLFQISTSPTTATLYFSPVSPASGYVVSYGTDSNAGQYTTSFNDNDTSGVVSYTINSLAENTTYYFKVQGINGCMPGNWSQTLTQITTGQTTTQAEVTRTPTSVPASNGTITVTKKEQTATAQHTSFPQQTTQNNGYSLAITVQKNGQPVVGATVELHSTPMRATTDQHGIARFSNVQKGKHTVLLAYNGYSGQENVAVSGDKKNISINMTIKLNNNGLSPLAIGIITVLICIIIAFAWCTFFSIKHRKKKKETE